MEKKQKDEKEDVMILTSLVFFFRVQQVKLSRSFEGYTEGFESIL